MAGPFRVKARSASPGIATGPVHLAQQRNLTASSRLQPAWRYDSLAAAIETAIGELEHLSQGADSESRDIIDFQIEVLHDPTIAEATASRMATGENVAFAWVNTLDGYIRELESSEEEQMRARAVDILDIKNRVLGALTGTPAADFPAGSVFVAPDMEPSRFLAHDWSAGGGIVLFNGSAVGHVALLARSRSIPMVVSAGPFTASDGHPIQVDGDNGEIVLQGGAPSIPAVDSQVTVVRDSKMDSDDGTVLTADGVQIRLFVNINDPDEIASVDAAAVAGVGLMRSEFAVMSVADAANEEMQFAIYRRVLEWAGEKPVTIRMFDIGGDKPLSGLDDLPALSAMGPRGIRLLLARPEIARIQARALLRSAVSGTLAVMLPMVTFPSEVEQMRQIFLDQASQLDRRGIPYRMPSIGMMVEVPAAALMLDTFTTADFFSFGTNDLAQYLIASARDGSGVETQDDKARPAVLRLLEQAAKLAAGKPVSICGDMASDPECLSSLLAAGLRHFSVAPARLRAIRSAIVGLNADGTTAAGE
jgi:phosphotransferase system enzyme I (PtsI)